MEDIGGVNVLKTPQNLVKEVADVLVTQFLGPEQLVQVRLHQGLHNVDVPQLFNGMRTKNITDVNYLPNKSYCEIMKNTSPPNNLHSRA